MNLLFFLSWKILDIYLLYFSSKSFMLELMKNKSTFHCLIYGKFKVILHLLKNDETKRYQILKK